MPDKLPLFSGLVANIVIPVALALATNGMINLISRLRAMS
jgi:hypothetical protein